MRTHFSLVLIDKGKSNNIRINMKTYEFTDQPYEILNPNISYLTNKIPQIAFTLVQLSLSGYFDINQSIKCLSMAFYQNIHEPS